ncbi:MULTISPECIES: restriction endonuclease subunit S [unclassified Shewanella]|uniref:restriction endonuclease subunit S n=1 Tax=unclassified Shewanella TaxID=196818 RepID=UPI002002DF74|nr:MULTISPECIES: restriction endonuclease subunit S [unclassified Shewanella]MCK7633028.1 restriction endonuclease subunit S [Shewanella sp. JNE17]MCK7648373.1 restriction endonuclease subunit S [Shewanella sp. JNE8]MCK7656467.1 restriction endonuclease subunit S [Shewanella sp. JNE4-2]UPO32958.1 restriction endonuclease subunit S [Shewanella sp. JNE2]
MSSPVAINKKFAAYPEYKDSDIEWVGDIPINWNVLPAFAVLREECIRNLDGAETNVLSLSYGAIKQRDVESNAGLLPESFNTYQLVNYGDIVLRLTDLQNDKRSLRVGRSTQKGIITSAYMKLVCLHQLDNRFAYQLLHSYDTTKVFYGMGGGLRQSMKFEDFRRLPVIVPPLEEQRTIAAFLDYETARIDQLIAKQQRLIELLKEKRQAVISHAVTKGLNPDAPMKDSGVEWLGQVPEHWQVLKGAWIGKLFGSETVSEGDLTDNGDVAFIKVSTLSLDSLVTREPESYTCSLKYAQSKSKKNYIVFPKRGAAIFTNKVNIVDYPSVLDPNLMGWQIDRSFNTTYVAYCLKVRKLDDIADVSTVPQINNKHISPQYFPIPLKEEQDEIVELIDGHNVKFSYLIDKAILAVELLQERRIALISAAVTGKIDLREWRPPVKDAVA